MTLRPPLLLLAAVLLLHAPVSIAQEAAVTERSALTVGQIMQDPRTWIGAWPSEAFWTIDGEHAYFSWNPRGEFPADSLFRVPAGGGAIEPVTFAQRQHMAPRFDGWHANRHVFSPDFSRMVFERQGDLFIYDLAERALHQLTRDRAMDQNPRFSLGRHDRVTFVRDNNVYALDLSGAAPALTRLTDLRSGRAPEDPRLDERQRLLEAQQLELFDVLRARAHLDSLARAARERQERARMLPPTFYVGDRTIQQLQISPDERFATFVLAEIVEARRTTMTDYVTRTGYAEQITARPKVGGPGSRFELHVQDLLADTVFVVDLTALPGAFEPAAYQRAQGIERDTLRSFIPFGPYWSPDGQYAVLDVRTRDNKDRWIARLNPHDGSVTALHHDRDEAWIAGPGISWWVGPSRVGWLPDSRRFWFHSERSGYGHLYTVDVQHGTLVPVTQGPFEVESATISRDGRWWFLQTSEGSPFERHAWRLPIGPRAEPGTGGGPRERLTSVRGRHDFSLHPQEHALVTLFSTSNHPPEVYLQPLAAGARAQRVTYSPTEEWLSLGWRPAEIIEIPASDGARVPAIIHRPANPNGAAVLFVHGAGYLQNVHHWWSQYFRENMFHHLLAERGYVVLDVDYRGSAGYGRDWRTAIYRHMGGRDLQDFVDASLWLREEFGIPPERVGIYGGSYGGFITLMALFTEPEHFGAGAALRAVTDWAHYNDPYTSNILNFPTTDPEAYARSSPINFAAGLRDPLLMAHGLVDRNVQPQDIFRLSQRLIELGKENWELAIYPVEDHGFVEPTSWTDQYRRILKLFEEHLHPVAAPLP